MKQWFSADIETRTVRRSDSCTTWRWSMRAHMAEGGPWDDDLDAIGETYLERGGEFLVGVDGQQIVAMGALRRCDTDRAELKRMRVHPCVQRRGFGRRLLHSLEERALELGYRTLALDTTVQQQAARALYLNKGYRETGRGHAGSFELVFFEKQLA